MKVAASRWLSVSTIALGLVFSGGAFAQSKNSVVEIVSQGSGECNTYAIANIQSISWNTVSFPGGDQSNASYTLSEDKKVFSFESEIPINFAILKSQQNVRIFYYKPGGDLSDEGMKLDNGGGALAIQSASLCYGQAGTVQPKDPVDLPDCRDLNQQLLDQTGITCPAMGQRVLVSLDPSEPKWNPTLCTCNVSGSFTQCNADAEEGEEGFCPGSHPLRALPTVIEAGNDKTWVCTTVGGTRTCYKI